MEISFLLVLSGVWKRIYNTKSLLGQANESITGFLSSAYKYGHSDTSNNLDYGIIKTPFYQNECRESIDDRLARQKAKTKKLNKQKSKTKQKNRTLLRRRSM